MAVGVKILLPGISVCIGPRGILGWVYPGMLSVMLFSLLWCGAACSSRPLPRSSGLILPLPLYLRLDNREQDALGSFRGLNIICWERLCKWRG